MCRRCTAAATLHWSVQCTCILWSPWHACVRAASSHDSAPAHPFLPPNVQACTCTALLKDVILNKGLLSACAGIYGGFKPKRFPAVVGLEGEQAPVTSVQHHPATGSSTLIWHAWLVTTQP